MMQLRISAGCSLDTLNENGYHCRMLSSSTNPLLPVTTWGRALAFVLLWVCASPFAQSAAPSPQEQAQSVIHMLDYVSVDYPEFVKNGQVLDAAEYEEQREFATRSIALLEQLPERPAKAAVVAEARRLLALIESRAEGAQVSALAGQLGAQVMQVWQLTVAPRAAPDVQRAASLFQAQCAACHGATGRGDGPAGKGLEPAPSDFHDADRMSQRSLYGLYNTITLGVGGTGMQAYTQLSEADRWALAFFTAGMRQSPQTVARGEELWSRGEGSGQITDFRALVTTTPVELARRGGEPLAAVGAFLTARPSVLAAAGPAPLVHAREQLAQTVDAVREGDRARARQHAISAYLEGFELVEAQLDPIDGALRLEIEREMMGLRSAIDRGTAPDDVAAQVERITRLLQQAADRLDGEGLSPTAAFAASLLILLREGLEAILVLAAVIAFVRKSGRRDALPWIHAGWMAAVVAGGATWYAATHLVTISGASRELTEGVAALLAAAMLLYVGAWLHRRASAQAWQAFVREHVGGALQQRTLWALAGIAFLAVYRELFEIILFYQALWTQVGPEGEGALLGGMAAAAALLAVLGWAILKYGVRLPIGPFFAATAGLLALLAFVFVGHGVAALQEAGVLTFTPVRVVAVPLLGIQPSAEGLGAQGAVLLAVLLFSTLAMRSRRAGASRSARG